jgi:hypothetical protein
MEIRAFGDLGQVSVLSLGGGGIVVLEVKNRTELQECVEAADAIAKRDSSH